METTWILDFRLPWQYVVSPTPCSSRSVVAPRGAAPLREVRVRLRRPWLRVIHRRVLGLGELPLSRLDAVPASDRCWQIFWLPVNNYENADNVFEKEWKSTHVHQHVNLEKLRFLGLSKLPIRRLDAVPCRYLDHRWDDQSRVLHGVSYQGVLYNLVGSAFI